MFLAKSLCLFLFCNGCLSQVPTIILLEPLNSALYILGAADGAISTNVVYEVQNLSSLLLTSPQVCLHLVSDLTYEELLPSTCFEANEETVSRKFNGIPKGSFRLNLSLVSNGVPVTSESVTSTFHVRYVEELLPEITVLKEQNTHEHFSPDNYAHVSRELNVVATQPADGQLSNVKIEYMLGESLLQMDNIEVCVHLSEVNTNIDVLQLACVPSSQRILTFQALSVGSYSLTLTLAKKANDDLKIERELYLSSERKMLINVKSITDDGMMPYIALNEAPSEMGVHSADDKADFNVVFGIRGTSSSVDQVQVCARVDSIKVRGLGGVIGDSDYKGVSDEFSSSITPVMALSCVSPGETSFVLKGLTEGIYSVHLLLRLRAAPHTTFESSMKKFHLDVRIFNEFVPSYNWQPLHAWHTIPTGIQTR